MQTLTAAPAPVANARRAPLMLHEVPASRRRQITADRQAKAISQPRLDAGLSASPAALAREASEDRRSTQDRVLDRVVDGLMKDLGW